MEFNYKEKAFQFEFDADSSIKAPTIIYVPNIQYPNGYDIKISDGLIEKKEREQLIFIKTKRDGLHIVSITEIP
ncbi:MAG: hypothetical protein ACFFDN_12955 [Candidatus Hodarchaeota archaeon]